jgi:hypothetical protein
LFGAIPQAAGLLRQAVRQCGGLLEAATPFYHDFLVVSRSSIGEF